MTRQEAFDLVIEKITKQGKPGGFDRDGWFLCQYINGNGSRCAIGHLLDEETAQNFEDVSFGTIGVGPEDLLPDFIREDLDFFHALQQAHDNAAMRDEDFLSGFLRRMEDMAKDFGLTVSHT